MTEVMTTGWVGFGFATQAPTGMIGYDVAVGGVFNGTGYLTVKHRENMYFVVGVAVT